MTTRVVIDGSALGDASAFRGIGRYLRGLLDGLARSEAIEPVVLTTRSAALPDGVARRTLHRYAPGRFADREHELLLPLNLSRVSGDVVHSPAQSPPARCTRPWVQTLHGLVPLVDPDPGFDHERKLWARWEPRMRRAAAVVAVSEFCAEQGIRLLGLDPRRMHVIHHGVDDVFRQGTGEPESDTPYALMVAEFGPSKGHPDGYAAIAAAAERGLPHRLKVVGRIAPWFREQIESQVAGSARPDRIELLGYVGDQLPALYRGASALILPTRYESFCLPAVEAMASGTPVVAYRNTALPEILRDACRWVQDGDVADLSQKTIEVLSTAGLAGELRQAGYARSLAFSWDNCAAQHADIYSSLAS